MSESKYDIVKFVDNGFELDVNVNPKGETIWLSQTQMALLFDVDRTRITRHINNVFKENELIEDSNVRKTHITNTYKPQFYIHLM